MADGLRRRAAVVATSTHRRRAPIRRRRAPISLHRVLSRCGRLRDDHGAAAVEFALVVPVLLLLVFGIAEFGRAYNIQTTLSGAAREGARTMALENDVGAATAATVAAARPLDLGGGQISVSPGACPLTDTTPSDTVRVTVTYQMALLTNLFGSSIRLTGSGVMLCNG